MCTIRQKEGNKFHDGNDGIIPRWKYHQKLGHSVHWQHFFNYETIHQNMTTVAYFGRPFCGRSQAIEYALDKGDYMKLGEPLDLGTIQIRQAMGSRGFKTISEEPAINLISDPIVLQILNAEVDMAGGILWGAWEANLFDSKLHPPLLIHKYSSALDQIKENRNQEDGLLLRISHLEMENERIIKELQAEKEERETAACDSDDAQEKIRQMQMVIDKYEGLAIDI